MIGKLFHLFVYWRLLLRRKQLYLRAGILCLGISFCLNAYNRITASSTTSITADQPISVSINANSKTLVANGSARKTEKANLIKANRDERVDLSNRQKLSAGNRDPQSLSSPTPEQQRTEVIQLPDRITPQQCAERLAALGRGEYPYIPPECENQYRAWRKSKYREPD
jgi:hypothetical protein